MPIITVIYAQHHTKAKLNKREGKKESDFVTQDTHRAKVTYK